MMSIPSERLSGFPYRLLAGVILAACSSATDPAPETPTASILGTWAEVSSQSVNCIDPVNNTAEQPCGTLCKVYEFTQTTYLHGGFIGGPFSGTYTIDGDSIRFSDPLGMVMAVKVTGSTLELRWKGSGCTSVFKYQKTS